MRKVSKQIITFILIIVMLFTSVSFIGENLQVSAIDSRVEQAVQTAIAIANDNSHGYSQSSRWGPDYDCSSLVYYAFSSAGFSFSTTWFRTWEMHSALTGAGFVELTNINLSNSNSLQRGDILWKNGHTEIYIGNNQLVGAHYHYGYTQEGDQNGKEISVGSYYYMSDKDDPTTAWTKVYRYGGADTSKPTNLSISANFTSIGVGDTVTFTYNIEGATNKCIGIDKNGTRYKSIGVSESNGTATYTFKEAGTYCCIIEGSNNVGYSCSSMGAWITVVDTKPTDFEISANHTSIGVGDTVTFTYNIKGATNKCIGIDKGGSRYKSLGVSSDTGSVSYTFTEPGVYCCIIEGSNSIGYSCSSSGVWITVIDTKPTDFEISADKTSIGVGDTVTFTYNIKGATNKCIGIDKDGSRYKSIGVSQNNGTTTYKFTEVGTYCCIIEGSNSIGYSCSDKGVWITVHDQNQTFNITYNPKGGENAPVSQVKIPGEDITLSSSKPTRDGYMFLGWSTDSDSDIIEYFPGDTYSEDMDITLYAVWKEIIFIEGEIITFGEVSDEITFDFASVGEPFRSYGLTFDGNSTEYAISGIMPGEYTLKVTKKNHVSHEYYIDLSEDTILDIQLNLIGDINGDGKVNTLDTARANSHAKGVTALTDYDFACADTNGDGKVNTLDVARMNSHAKGVTALW